MAERKPISDRMRFRIFDRDRFTCNYCGESAPNVILELDHRLAHSKGGGDTEDNLVTSCKECNRGKGDMDCDKPVEGFERGPKHPLTGLTFHKISGDVIERQGMVLGIVPETASALVVYFSWITGDPTNRAMIPLIDMIEPGYRFYATTDDMDDAWQKSQK